MRLSPTTKHNTHTLVPSNGERRVLAPGTLRNSRSSTITSLNVKLDDVEALLFGNLFGQESPPEEVDPVKELALFPSLATGSFDDVALAHTSLESFICQWAFLLEKADGTEKLTTPITSTPFIELRTTVADNDRATAKMSTTEDQKEQNNASKTSGMKIMFRPPKRYLSRDEQKAMEKGTLPDRKGAKLDSKSPGGIQLLVQSSKIAGKEEYELRLIGKRCAVDSDTVIKVKSERTIIRRLREAIRIWGKVREWRTSQR